MKVIALDYGKSRIGVAIGDESIRIAFPRELLKNDENLNKKLVQIIEQENVSKVLLGRPLMLDGEESNSTYFVNEFAEDFKNFLAKNSLEKVSLEFIDERFSTNIAQERLNSADWKQKKKRENIDSLSAQVLLEAYFKRRA